MASAPSDLTSAARIRNAALQAFAAQGVAGTSIRDVAKAAAVSPGLVQHHFRSKAGLRRAVDDFVVGRAIAVFGDPVRGTSPAEAPRRLPPQRGGACPHGTRHDRALPEGHLPPAPQEAPKPPVTDYPNRLRTFTVVPSHYKAMWWIDRLSPALGRFLAGKLFA